MNMTLETLPHELPSITIMDSTDTRKCYFHFRDKPTDEINRKEIRKTIATSGKGTINRLIVNTHESQAHLQKHTHTKHHSLLNCQHKL